MKKNDELPVSTTPDERTVVQAAIAPLTYRSDIDGMRAIAVLLVLVFHFSLVPIIKAGFLGVDVFFVISGFLITTILKKQLDEGAFDLRQFYVNRVRRLAPALFFVLLVVMTAGAMCLFPSELIDLAKQVSVSQFYVSNVYYWRNINYFGLDVHGIFLLHTWSLAVEEQFYLLYPVCIWLLYQNFKKYFWSVILLAFLTSFGLNILLIAQKPEATFYLLPTRAWELLMGGLVTLVAGIWFRSRCIDEILGWLGVSLVILAVICYQSDIYIPGYYALLPTIGTACLLLSGQHGITVPSKILGWPPIVYLGKISYSLYLVHWPINVFANRLISNYSTASRIAMFSLSIMLAAVVYHAVENPMRLKRRLGTNKKLLLGYVAGLAVTVSLFVGVYVSGGLPQRFPGEVIHLASFAHDTTAPLRECEFEGQSLTSASSFCEIGVAGQNPSWLVYGDSHAWASHAAFDKWLKLNGQAGLFIFRHACPPLNGVHLSGDRGMCFAFNQAVNHFIESRPDLGNIVLVSIWRQAIEGALSKSSQIVSTKGESLQIFTDQFYGTLEHLHALGRHVNIWEPVPGARKDVPRELARAALAQRVADIEIYLHEYLSTYGFFFEALEKSRKWTSASFSPSQALCENGKCLVSYNGTPLYADGNHITKSSVDFWVRVLQRGLPSQ